MPLVVLENQISENKEGENDFKVCFVLFVLDALLCPTMKFFVKHSFLHLVEDIDSIKKMNWAEFVSSYFVHEIKELKRKKQSGFCDCLLFFMVISSYIIYVIVNFELVIGRIVFWAQLGLKINIWSIYHAYLSPRPKQRMKIKMKDIVFH